MVSESVPPAPAGESAELATSDPLAARLLATQRLLAALDPASEVRIRLNLRFTAICTAVKTPGSSRSSCLDRLDSLAAEAEQARHNAAKEGD